jgi:predicted Fe-S protein YdhL (DUF1289 family)
MYLINYIEEGNLDKTKQFLQDNPNYDIHANDDYAFCLSCYKGYLDIAKWLWNISDQKINIHAIDERAFCLSCAKGHLDVAKWLWDISDHKINIHADNEKAFRWCCYNCHLDVVKWLRDISNHKINIHALDDYAFRLSCFRSHLNVARWFLNLDFDYFANWIKKNKFDAKIKLELQNIIDAKITENMIESKPQINKDTIIII